MIFNNDFGGMGGFGGNGNGGGYRRGNYIGGGYGGLGAFGGNPLACAAALAVLETIKDDDLLVNVNENSELIMSKLYALQKKYPCIKDVRGKGLLLGIEFDETISASQMRIELFTKGFLISSIGTSTIRIAPPLVLKKQQALSFVKALDQILKNTIPAKRSIRDLLGTNKDTSGENK